MATIVSDMEKCYIVNIVSQCSLNVDEVSTTDVKEQELRSEQHFAYIFYVWSKWYPLSRFETRKV